MGLFDKLKKGKKDKALTGRELRETGVKRSKKDQRRGVADKKSEDEIRMADLYTGKEGSALKKDSADKKGKVSGAQRMAKPVKGDTKNAYKVLIKPVVSEKASLLGQFNQYIFEVAPRANKIEIAKAVRSLYGVDPIKVNIVKVKGKGIRYGRTQGRTKNWKKAIITLKSGQSIQVYEGV